MLTRRLTLASALAAPAALAQTRAATLMVGFAPGGGTDIISRLLVPRMSEELGQSVVVENRPGASGTLAAIATARAKPDGYTMLMGTVSTQAVVAPLMPVPPYDQMTDFTPVTLAATVPLVLVVPKDSPAKDLAGLLALAKAKPGALNYGSSGVATQQHLAAELLARSAGVEMTHVPYRGTGQVVNDILAGRLDFVIDTLPTHLPHIRAGASRALATTLPQRVEWLPDVPAVAETVPGFDMSVWYMLLGPGGLPGPLTARWSAAANAALSDPAIRARVTEAGFIPGGGSPADAAALVRREAERYAALVRDANIRLE